MRAEAEGRGGCYRVWCGEIEGAGCRRLDVAGMKLMIVGIVLHKLRRIFGSSIGFYFFSGFNVSSASIHRISEV